MYIWTEPFGVFQRLRSGTRLQLKDVSQGVSVMQRERYSRVGTYKLDHSMKLISVTNVT